MFWSIMGIEEDPLQENPDMIYRIRIKKKKKFEALEIEECQRLENKILDLER